MSAEDNEKGRELLDQIGYEKSTEAADRLGIHHSVVRRYCNDGRWEDAALIANRWFVPKGSTWERIRPEYKLSGKERAYMRDRQRLHREKLKEPAPSS